MRYLYYSPFFDKEWRSHFSTESGWQYLAASDTALVNLIKPDEIITEAMGRSLSDKMGYKNYMDPKNSGRFNMPLGIDFEIVMGMGGWGVHHEQSMLPMINEGDELVFFQCIIVFMSFLEKHRDCWKHFGERE